MEEKEGERIRGEGGGKERKKKQEKVEMEREEKFEGKVFDLKSSGPILTRR